MKNLFAVLLLLFLFLTSVHTVKALGFDPSAIDKGLANEVSCNKNPDDGLATGLGCVPIFSGINQTSGFFWKWAFGLGGGIALLMITYAGFLYMTSQGSPDKLAMSKEVVIAAMSGIAVLSLAGFILRLLGVDILGLF